MVADLFTVQFGEQSYCGGVVMLVEFEDAPGFHLLEFTEAPEDQELEGLAVWIGDEGSYAKESTELKLILEFFFVGRF